MLRKLVRGLIASLLIAGVTVGFATTSTPYSATWSWTAPSTYTDGTPIASTTTITYKLFTGFASNTESTTPVWTGTALTDTTTGYVGGETVYGYLEACVTSSSGTQLCSVPSNEVSKSFPLPAPAAPSNLTVK